MTNLTRLSVVVTLLVSSVCFAENNGPASIGLDEAAKEIIEGTYDKVLGAQTENIEGRLVHVIKAITPDGRIRHYKIDAETGRAAGSL